MVESLKFTNFVVVNKYSMKGTSIIRKLKPETYGSAYFSLFKLGLPVLGTQLGIILVNFADTMMIGA